MKHQVIVAAIALLASTAPGWAQGSKPAPMPCTSAMGLNYICDLGRPEDFVWIPGTKYIITGGSVATGGWGLLDTETKTVRQLDLRWRPLKWCHYAMWTKTCWNTRRK